MTNTFITDTVYDKYTQYIHDTVVYDNYMYYIHIYPRTVSTICLVGISLKLGSKQVSIDEGRSEILGISGVLGYSTREELTRRL